MAPPRAAGCSGVHVVDTQLLGLPGVMSAYVVDAERPAVVDPGAPASVEPLLDGLAALGVEPGDVAEILVTHVHLDHAGATGALARACGNATVRVHERGHPFLTDADRLGRLVESARRAMGDVADQYGEPDPVPADRCEPLADGDRVDLGDRHLDVVYAPGHAPHQVCLLDSRDRALFAADAAGMYLAGELYATTPAPDFDLEASLATLDRLLDVDPSVLAYAHFGARTDATAALDAYRELLPAWVEAVEAAAAEHGPDREAVTEALRGDWPSPTLERDVAGVLGWVDRRR